MRVVFMGTPQFAVPSLEALASVAEVVGAYTRPDAVSGRGGHPRPSPVKVAADALGIPVFQPATLRDHAAVEQLASLTPDIVVVAAYGLILPLGVLEAAPLGAVNVHASLLPRWRGAAPIQRAILAGDSVAGVSIMRMEQGLDTGPYCLQASVDVGVTYAPQLTEQLASLGAEALLAALPSLIDGSAAWVVQDESGVTYAEKVTKADVALSPLLGAEEAVRRVRASVSAAPSRLLLASRGVTVVRAEPAPADAPSVTQGRAACTKAGVLLGMADGSVLVTRLKPDGKGEMAAADWARGVRELDGATWEGPL